MHIAEAILAPALESLLSGSLVVKSSLAVEDLLHFLKRSTLGLFDEKEDQDRHDDVESGVEEEDVRAHVFDHVRGRQGEEEVEEPLSRDADRGADFADTGWEDLDTLVSVWSNTKAGFALPLLHMAMVVDPRRTGRLNW